MLQLLHQAELANILEISPRTLERWRIEGDGPPFMKAGRRVLYAARDVDQWLFATRRTSTSEAHSAQFKRVDVSHDATEEGLL